MWGMRKCILVFCLLVLAVVLAGCGSQNNRKEVVGDRQVITVGAIYDDGALEGIIDEYNKKSDTYRAQLRLYEEYENPREQFLLDVSRGKAPDVIAISEETPVSMLVGKSMLMNLDLYLAEDSELKKEELLDNVLQAIQVDGELYYVCEGVHLNSLLAKTAVVGEKNGWTEAEFMDFLSDRPQTLFDVNDKSSILTNLLQCNNGQYVDWKKGICSFDSESFKNLIEIADTGDDHMVPNTESVSRLQDGSCLFYQMQNADLGDVIAMFDMFGEPVTAIGYPSEDQNGSFFTLEHAFGICAQSQNTDGAWDFVRMFLTKEYQEIYYASKGGSIPIRKDVYKRMLSDAQITEEYTDSNGYVISPNSYQFQYGDYVRQYGAWTKGQIAVFNGLFERINKAVDNDSAIMNIIEEESNVYFEGDKSVEDTAHIIQDRVTTYLNEKR